MKTIKLGKSALGLLLASTCFLPTTLPAQDVKPGDVFREYVWRPKSNWARCTGEDASMSGARKFLPNPVNYIDVKDLKDATRVEVIVEKLLSHAGTNFPRIRVNRNAWIPIPTSDPKNIPGSTGQGGRKPYWYLTMRYPAISIPMSQLREGSNSFEFKCQAQGGDDLGRLWPQFIYYGVTFRVFYKSSKAHPTGVITSPKAGSSLGWDNPAAIKFEARVGHTGNGTVSKVDFIGNYNDFDWRGEGIEGLWKWNMLYGKLRYHIGTATVRGNTASTNWDASWIPTQPDGFAVLARVTDSTGMTFVTHAIDGLELRRKFTVKRYRNDSIALKWQSRYHTPAHNAYTTINDDVTKATAARVYMATWNGYEAQGIGINSRTMRYNIGKNHDLSYDYFSVPVGNIGRGRNRLHTYSRTMHHGIEVQWPGMELFVKYSFAETDGRSAAYSTGCFGSNGLPQISVGGRPIVGKSFAIGLNSARANAGAGLLIGTDNSKWASLPLPLPLGGLGAPGCLLLTSADIAATTVTNSSGQTGITFPVPNDRRLIGGSIYSQWVVFDSVNSMRAAFSNGLRSTFGDN